MEHDEVFMRLLEYQKLKYSLEKEGAIKPDHSNMVFIIFAFFSGFIIGSLIPW